MTRDKRFNIRVYGIYIDTGKLLVTDEYRMGIRMTKFPGGGLEFGEGLAECIKRECVEEFGQEFNVIDHFYTTDFFQASAFNKDHQLISVYYLVEPVRALSCRLASKAFEFENEVEGAQCFRWLNIDTLSEKDFTFPVDKVVAGMLKQRFRKGKP
jgi:8-oxo-dGTP diphosphatase